MEYNVCKSSWAEGEDACKISRDAKFCSGESLLHSQKWRLLTNESGRKRFCNMQTGKLIVKLKAYATQTTGGKYPNSAV